MVFSFLQLFVFNVFSVKSPWFRGVEPHLEENGVVGVSPEVRDRIATMAATGQYFETARALPVGAGLA
jgi:hypothetical protein